MSDSYLNLVFDPTGVSGQWDIHASDLEYVVGLDDNDDGVISPEELNAHHQAVDGYVSKRLGIKVDGKDCSWHITDRSIAAHQDGIYVSLQFSVDAPIQPKDLEISYRLFFDINPQHRGLMQLEVGGKKQTAVFTPDHSTNHLELEHPSAIAHFIAFLREGVWHIWLGFDHILFLLALLLPAVLQRKEGRWQAVDDFRPALVNVLKIVTAFTIAHSITLSLATLKIVEVPSRFIESAIAASVALAAVNNIRPFFREGAWLIAFAFGLIHGFGFANALTDLGASGTNLAMTLLGFNLGVETGQLAIVAAFLPLAYLTRSTFFYQRLTFVLGSSLIVCIASLWMVERMFALKLVPFLSP